MDIIAFGCWIIIQQNIKKKRYFLVQNKTHLFHLNLMEQISPMQMIILLNLKNSLEDKINILMNQMRYTNLDQT